jgi:hypothetical protein
MEERSQPEDEQEHAAEQGENQRISLTSWAGANAFFFELVIASSEFLKVDHLRAKESAAGSA